MNEEFGDAGFKVGQFPHPIAFDVLGFVLEVLVDEVVGEHDALGGKGRALGGASHFGQSGLRGHADG